MHPLNETRPLRVAALATHADDADYGIGGTLIQLAEAGCQVKIFVEVASQHGDVKSGRKFADLPGCSRELFEPANTYLMHYNADAVLELEAKLKDFAPDIVFMMQPRDNHMEHNAAAHIQADALFRVPGIKEIYAYEVGPLQSGVFMGMPDITVNCTDQMETLYKLYETFFESPDGVKYFNEEKEVHARFRGYCAYSGFKYGEALKVVRYPEKGGDFLLRQLLGDNFRWGGVGSYWRGREAYFF